MYIDTNKYLFNYMTRSNFPYYQNIPKLTPDHYKHSSFNPHNLTQSIILQAFSWTEAQSLSLPEESGRQLTMTSCSPPQPAPSSSWWWRMSPRWLGWRCAAAWSPPAPACWHPCNSSFIIWKFSPTNQTFIQQFINICC